MFELKETSNLSFFLPDLVVIKITPLLARIPYKAAAVGPFNTVTDSISSGLILAAPLGKSLPPPEPALP